MFPPVDRQGEAANEIERPRSAWQLIGATFALYQRFPLLFLVFAGVVVIPYQLIVLAVTGAGPLEQGSVGFGTSTLLDLIDVALIHSLISALHVHAVQDVREGIRPELRAVAKRSVRVLPVVSATVLMSFLGSTLGLVALIVPGVLLYLRWSVAGPAAALEKGGWTDALRRSAGLTEDNYWHVFGLLILVFIISAVPGFVLRLIFGNDHTTVASFLADTALTVIVASFTALAVALLYFDLKARFAERLATTKPEPAPGLRQHHRPHRRPARPGQLQRRGPPAGLVRQPGQALAHALLGGGRETGLEQAHGEDAEADARHLEGPQGDARKNVIARSATSSGASSAMK
jgi:hypothetical protein